MRIRFATRHYARYKLDYYYYLYYYYYYVRLLAADYFTERFCTVTKNWTVLNVFL